MYHSFHSLAASPSTLPNITAFFLHQLLLHQLFHRINWSINYFNCVLIVVLAHFVCVPCFICVVSRHHWTTGDRSQHVAVKDCSTSVLLLQWNSAIKWYLITNFTVRHWLLLLNQLKELRWSQSTKLIDWQNEKLTYHVLITTQVLAWCCEWQWPMF